MYTVYLNSTPLKILFLWQTLAKTFFLFSSLNSLRLTFSMHTFLFQIQTDSNCRYDSLRIYDGTYVDEDALIAKICSRGTDDVMSEEKNI